MKFNVFGWGVFIGLLWSASLPVIAIEPKIVEGGLDLTSGTLSDSSFHNIKADALETEVKKARAVRFFKLGILRFRNNLASAYFTQSPANIAPRISKRSRGQYERVIWLSLQALKQAENRGDRQGEAYSLESLGWAYFSLGQYQQAIDSLRKQLVIERQISNSDGEANALGNLSLAYFSLGQYQRAIASLQQALTIQREIRDRGGEAYSLVILGNAYFVLGQYQQAIEFYQQSLPITQGLGDRLGKVVALDNLGNAYLVLGQYQQAIEFYQQSLPIARELGDRLGEASSLGNLGNAYLGQGQYQQAVEFYQQSLIIARELGNRVKEANAMGNLGNAYKNLGEYEKSINYYQQSLAIDRKIGNREGEGITLSNIGRLFEEQEQKALAIVFYKESVNIREGIRSDISGLSKELQESYTATISGTYRRLADLLLSQGRILEAQQVLELLKIQEIRDYTSNRNAGGPTEEDLIFLIEELEIRDQHGQLVLFDQKLESCEQTRCPDLKEWREQRYDLQHKYYEAISILEELISKRRAQGPILDPNNLPKNARNILNAQAGTMLIYPFVTEDKLWLLLATQGGLPSIRQISVSQKEISEKVLELRELLNNSQSEIAKIQAVSKKIYEWLIEPLISELEAGDIKNLVFSLDDATRYIPMGVLFDGKNYLIEKYNVTTIISAELTDTRERLPPSVEETSVLAMGLSVAKEGFNALPHVETEIDVIVKEEESNDLGIYKGRGFLNSDFHRDNLIDNLEERQILHIATHGNFSPLRQENSYLLMGIGKLSLSTIKLLGSYMEDVHLVVLSACETAIADNSIQIGDGTEINSFSYSFLETGSAGGLGPKAVIASLWKVNDEKTSQLMQRFYQHLATESGITKAQALQKAQLSFLENADQAHPYL